MRRSNPWCDDIATIDALVAAGLSRTTVRRRVRRGAWQEPAPGVVCRTTGQLSDAQRLEVALQYAGAGAALSHASAGGFWGILRRPATPVVSVTVPHGRHLRSTGAVRVHQSGRPFRARWVAGRPLTPPARTAIDICLGLGDLDEVRDVLGRTLQSGRADVERLSEELAAAPSRGSLLPRLALGEVAHDAHAASEARFVTLVREAGLALPELNAAVLTRRGVRRIDALWRDLGKGVEIDGRAYHLSPAAWSADLRRQNDIQSEGIVLLRIAAHRLWTEPQAVVAEVVAFLGLLAA